MSTRGAVWALGLGHPLFGWNLWWRPKPGGPFRPLTPGPPAVEDAISSKSTFSHYCRSFVPAATVFLSTRPLRNVLYSQTLNMLSSLTLYWFFSPLILSLWDTRADWGRSSGQERIKGFSKNRVFIYRWVPFNPIFQIPLTSKSCSNHVQISHVLIYVLNFKLITLNSKSFGNHTSSCTLNSKCSKFSKQIT